MTGIGSAANAVDVTASSSATDVGRKNEDMDVPFAATLPSAIHTIADPGSSRCPLRPQALASANSAMTWRNPSRQSGRRKPKSAANLLQSSREYAGRRALVG